MARIFTFCMTSALCVLIAACASRSMHSASLEALSGTEAGSAGNLRASIPYSLPRALLRLNVKWEGRDKGVPKPLIVKFDETSHYPDPDARFSLTADPSAWANDDFTFQTTDGLLTSVNSVTLDKTGEALLKVVEIGAELAKGAVGPFTNRQKRARAEPAPFDLTLHFDPMDREDVEAVAKTLARKGIMFSVTEVSGAVLPTASTTGTGHECRHSVCYRVPVPIRLNFEGQDFTVFDGFASTFQALVPDTSATYGFDVTRAPCVSKTTTLTFKSGMLSKVHLKKDSEVVGCLSIPLDVLKAIVAVPAQLFQQQTDDVTAETNLLNAQANLIAAEAALIEARNPAGSGK